MVTFLLLVTAFFAIPVLFAVLFKQVKASRTSVLMGAFTGLFFSVLFLMGFVKIPSIHEAIYNLIEPEETIYTAGYDEQKFESIKTGMTADQVNKLMGEPLKRIDVDGHRVIWLYSKQGPHDTNYKIRNVWLQENKVVRIDRSFFVD